MSEVEPIEESAEFSFAIPESLESTVANIGDREIRQNFIDAVKSGGLETAMSISPAYIQGIQSKFQELSERAVSDSERQSFQLLQRILPQIAMAEMLNAAGESDEAQAVLDDVYTMLSQEVGEIDDHRDYFEALLDLV